MQSYAINVNKWLHGYEHIIAVISHFLQSKNFRTNFQYLSSTHCPKTLLIMYRVKVDFPIFFPPHRRRTGFPTIHKIKFVKKNTSKTFKVWIVLVSLWTITHFRSDIRCTIFCRMIVRFRSRFQFHNEGYILSFKMTLVACFYDY